MLVQVEGHLDISTGAQELLLEGVLMGVLSREVASNVVQAAFLDVGRDSPSMKLQTLGVIAELHGILRGYPCSDSSIHGGAGYILIRGCVGHNYHGSLV